MSSRSYRVPFNRPSIVGHELDYIRQALANAHIAGDGPFTRRCEAWLQEHWGTHRAFLTHSCTAALELAALLCELEPDDEVLMPSFTFVSTANAFVLRRARPVFVDIRPETLNLDEQLLEAAITARTRAIVPVHYAGVGCEMESILALAHQHGLRVIEDAAQAVGSTYDGIPLGTLGDLGCWSFHETKNVISGEGGALAVRDPQLVERAEILREKGTDRARFFRGQVDKYTWVDVGSSYLPSELVAAFLCGQLEHGDSILRRRREIFDRYRAELADLEGDGLARLPMVPRRCVSNGHLFYLLLPTEARRNELLAQLDAAGVNATFHFVPLHESPMGRRLGRVHGVLPVTETTSRRLLRLPCFTSLTEDQQTYVIHTVRSSLQATAGRRPVSLASRTDG